MPDPIRFTDADIARLGEKLDSLDLDANERGLLDAIFATAQAASSEVAGFTAQPTPQPTPTLGQSLQNSLAPVKVAGFPNLGKNAIEYV